MENAGQPAKTRSKLASQALPLAMLTTDDIDSQVEAYKTWQSTVLAMGQLLPADWDHNPRVPGPAGCPRNH